MERTREKERTRAGLASYAYESLHTEVRVTSSGLDREDTIVDGQERHIECTTSEIKNEDGLGGL